MMKSVSHSVSHSVSNVVHGIERFLDLMPEPLVLKALEAPEPSRRGH